MHENGAHITAHGVFSKAELDAVIESLSDRSRKRPQILCSLALFRLSSFCGLRVSEATGLRLGDLRLNSTKPALQVPKHIAKGGKGRLVPVWFAGAVDDLKRWAAYRESMGAQDRDVFLCSIQGTSLGNPIIRQVARRRFRSACAVLGPDRARTVTTHTGRHTFASMCLALGKPPPAVRDACGHSSIHVTNRYAHLWDDGQNNSYYLD